MRRRPPSPLPLLLLALACTAGPPPDSSEALARFPALHERVVRAQALPADPEALHRHLSAALTGPALTRAFLQAAAGARRRDREGGRVDIEAVRYEAVELARRQGGRTELDATWVVTGTVHHGDHAHRRATRYSGRYALEQTPDGVRIAAERARDATRLPAPPPTEAGGTTPAMDLLGDAP